MKRYFYAMKRIWPKVKKLLTVLTNLNSFSLLITWNSTKISSMRIKLELIVATVDLYEDARWSHSKNTFMSKGYRGFTIALLSFHSMWMLHLSHERRWDKTSQMKTFPSKNHEKLFQHVVSNGQGKVCKIVYQHYKSNVLHVHMPQNCILLAHLVPASDF